MRSSVSYGVNNQSPYTSLVLPAELTEALRALENAVCRACRWCANKIQNLGRALFSCRAGAPAPVNHDPRLFSSVQGSKNNDWSVSGASDDISFSSVPPSEEVTQFARNGSRSEDSFSRRDALSDSKSKTWERSGVADDEFNQSVAENESRSAAESFVRIRQRGDQEAVKELSDSSGEGGSLEAELMRISKTISESDRAHFDAIAKYLIENPPSENNSGIMVFRRDAGRDERSYREACNSVLVVAEKYLKKLYSDVSGEVVEDVCKKISDTEVLGGLGENGNKWADGLVLLSFANKWKGVGDNFSDEFIKFMRAMVSAVKVWDKSGRTEGCIISNSLILRGVGKVVADDLVKACEGKDALRRCLYLSMGRLMIAMARGTLDFPEFDQEFRGKVDFGVGDDRVPNKSSQPA